MRVPRPRFELPGEVLISLLLLALGGQRAHGQEIPEAPAAPVAWQVGSHFLSRYVFGGPTFSEEPVVQPHASAAWRDLKLTTFGVFYTNVNDLLEADVFLEYGRPIGRVWLFGAASVYNFKFETGWESTFELYGGATYDSFLQPTLEIYHDFDIGDGTVVSLSASHGFPIGEVPLTASLALAYNDQYYREGSGLGYVELSLVAPLALGSGVTLTPRIMFLRSLDEPEIQSAIYGGATLAVDF